jgi:hypothetical protein
MPARHGKPRRSGSAAGRVPRQERDYDDIVTGTARG